MDSCKPIPCPPIRETTLHVDGICDCPDYTTPGNPNCVIHGPQVQAWIEGYRAALDVLKASHAQLFQALPFYGAPR